MTLPHLRYQLAKAATHLGFSTRTLRRRWAKYGFLLVRDGGHTYVRTCDIESYERLVAEESAGFVRK